MKYLLVAMFAGVVFAQGSGPEARAVEGPAAPAVKPGVPPKPPAAKLDAVKPDAVKPDVAATAEKASKPKAESLKYEITWPSGLSLGEAILTAAPTDTLLHFAFQMDASVPGFSISESVDSRATPEFCSTLLYKRGTRGKRKVDERTEFGAAKMKATRTTEGGGKSELSTPACAKDALTFLHFLRRELAAGRLPPQQRVFYGGPYSVTVKFAATEKVTVGGEASEAEKIEATIKGAAADVTAEIFFAKDAKRTPLLVQVPLKVGKLRLELVR